MRKIAFTIIIILLFAEFADAQSFYSRRRDRKWMFNYGLGFTTYHGDLYAIGTDKLKSFNSSFGLGIRRKIGSQLSLRLDFNSYRLEADDALENQSTLFPSQDAPDRAQRNLSFRTRNYEFSAMAIFNLIPVKGTYASRPILNPYFFIGYGITTVNPRANYEGEWHDLRVLQTEGKTYGNTASIIPYGLGLKLKANQYIDILFEIGRRATSTDRLDDVSQKHVDLAIFDEIHEGNPERIALAKALSDRAEEAGYPARGEGRIRGNDGNNDAYYIYQFRLEMYLPDGFFRNIFSPSKRKPKFR